MCAVDCYDVHSIGASSQRTEKLNRSIYNCCGHLRAFKFPLHRVHSNWAIEIERKQGGTPCVHSVHRSITCKHDIHDEDGENESTVTMEMMRVRLNCETRKTARGGKAPGKSKQTGDEIETMRRVGANMRGSGTIDDIELRVVLETG
jgi:hypothetical protein